MAVIKSSKKIIVRYIVFLVCISIIPLLFIGVLSYEASSRSLLEAEDRSINALLKGQHERLILQLDQVENLIANITGVEEITKVLDDQYVETDAYTSLATQARIGYILNGYLNLEGLVSIDIFTEGGAHYYVGDTLNAGEINQDVVEQIKHGAMTSNRQVYWAGIRKNIHDSSSQQYVLSAASVIKLFDRVTRKQRSIATVMVNYSQKYLEKEFSKIETMPGGELELLDQHGNIIIDSENRDIGLPAKEIFAHAMTLDSTDSKFDWKGTRYLIKHQSVPEYGWQMLNVIPEEVLLSKVSPIRDVTLVLLALSFLLVALAIWIFTRNILTPIREVIRGYQQLENDELDLEKRLEVRSADEIGELTRWFNSFLDNLESRRRSEAALRESEHRYELVVNASHEVLWDWDLLTESFYISPRFIAMIGEEGEANLASNPSVWLERIHTDDRIMVMDEIDQHLTGKTSHFECEYRLIRNDGSILWVLSHGLAEFDEENKAVRIAGSHTDISGRKEAENQLRHDAFHDVLTGLYNRAWFVSYLDVKIKECSRQKSKEFAVFFLDLDQFKSINDTLGHSAGDELLIQVSDRLKDCLREADQLARLGGDEFVILLESSHESQYIFVAERILNALARPFIIKGQNVMSGVSIGISRSAPEYQDPDEMLRDADIAMYQAKMSGKNCYVLFDANMREDLLQRISLEHDLKKALTDDQLELYYQPVISLQSGRLIGCEALIRWNHPENGMIGPDIFIPVAESSNLIFSVGQWVLEEACQQWQTWKKESIDLSSLKLSINISSLQFNDKEFLRNLPKTLAAYGIDGSELAFEITETAIVQDVLQAARVIHEFKDIGIEVHLDDFGTGYSSLSHLSDFPIDLIKIDRSFVMQCFEREKYKRVVRGILDMAQELRIKCTAEGIESSEQLALLKDNDCEYGQGFHISRPLTAQQMLDLIRKDHAVVLAIGER